MSVPARRSRQGHAHETTAFQFGSAGSFDTLDAGEPLYPPRRRGSSMVSAALVLVVLFGGGWAVLQAPAPVLETIGAKVAAIAGMVRDYRATSAAPSNVSRAATDPAPPVAEPAAPVPPLASEEPMNVGGDAATPPDAVPVETGAIGVPSEQEEASEPQPLPPPRVDPGDPYQQRAVAVGLHPDLSKVLLRRMTADDYRNAGYAIDTAIAKTADEAVFIWPRQRKPEQALFRVHFVKGAAVQCRRYVVTVVKDRWTTTALPMERCGAELAATRAAAKAAPAAVADR